MSDCSHLRVRLLGRLDRAKREGFLANATALGGFVVSAALWLLLLPLTAVLHLAGFRRLTVLGERIGHLAGEVDCFLMKREMGEIRRGRRHFLAIPADRAANDHLLHYWRSHLPVISHPLLAHLLVAMSRWLLMREDVSGYLLRLNRSAEIYRVFAGWGGRPSILRLTDEDRAWGREKLKTLELPADAWFVCVHVREPGFSPRDEWAHAYRNAHIETAIPAMREIVRQGGWCIRMGDPSMTPLPVLEHVIDYAHHPLRCPRLDVVLCAQCRFFLGDTSGLTFVGAAFGVPSALANMVPASALGLLPSDLSIPKLLRLKREDRYLSWPEILTSAVANYRFASLYDEAGIAVEENSADEIVELVEEMLQRLAGSFAESDGDRELQRRFRELLRPGHYSFGTPARMATTFLRWHRELLDSPCARQFAP